jgi:hypothetical protein
MKVERNNTFLMLGHKLRVTTVKPTEFFHNSECQMRIFMTCADDCLCEPKFLGIPRFPVKLQILESQLQEVTLDKL